MLRRLSTTALTALLLVGATNAAGANAAPARAAAQSEGLSLTPQALRIVPDTRSELRDLPPAPRVDPAAPEAAVVAPPVEEPPAAPAPVAPLAAWPVDPGLPITDGFGPREAPTAGASTNHRGIDVGAPAGTPVVAAAAGTVTQVVAVDSGGCGIEIVIQHDAPVGFVSTRYCHLLDGSPLVEVGSVVGVGQQIAAVGSTGVSTGAHLHFEVLLPGGEAIDPLPWLGQHTVPAV
ncbi:M23 family metallopeptidase [Leifsonia shinshuensis]|uniref:M23 family metallopeptidase n=1 Tax=Leifsonia shinshuensis TaxID=150026 RepID=UPI00286216D5|nr:M23 family metallopeptidase [Leifsonia shinshuensis]MDR6972536.1 murein DD-endopeptidase MepM/ murein hydrolase activator NlpD [Leifsonia shinshuensis]